MQRQFDIALCSAYNVMRKEGSTRVFCELRWAVLKLVLGPLADLKAILGATSSWTPYKKQLDRVVSSSALGRAMFGFAQTHIVCEASRQ